MKQQRNSCNKRNQRHRNKDQKRLKKMAASGSPARSMRLSSTIRSSALVCFVLFFCFLCCFMLQLLCESISLFSSFSTLLRSFLCSVTNWNCSFAGSKAEQGGNSWSCKYERFHQSVAVDCVDWWTIIWAITTRNCLWPFWTFRNIHFGTHSEKQR